MEEEDQVRCFGIPIGGGELCWVPRRETSKEKEEGRRGWELEREEVGCSPFPG